MSTEDPIAEAREGVKGHAPTESEVLAYRLADALEVAVEGLQDRRARLEAAESKIQRALAVDLRRDVPPYRAWPAYQDEVRRILSEGSDQ